MENVNPLTNGRGVFKDPLHDACRQRNHTQSRSEDQSRMIGGPRETYQESQSLRHLKQTFPVYKDGSDSVELLRDCEDYFNIYQV